MNTLCGLLLLLCCVRTFASTKDILISSGSSEFDSFSLWPSVHNAAKLMRLRRDANQTVPVESGAKVIIDTSSKGTPPPTVTPVSANKADVKEDNKAENTNPSTTLSGHGTEAPVLNSTTAVPVTNANETKSNITSTEKTEKKVDLNNPGVLKRGLIVFGGFALMAVAYFIFYKRKNIKNDSGNTHNTIDANQFRYGVLQSEDRRDNLELSRVPLTMESDDDDDDDMEIFDLEQKKKSLSYVNLQTNDEDVVFPNMETNDNDRDNLLLDIEDATSDTLINWSSNGSKSIL